MWKWSGFGLVLPLVAWIALEWMDFDGEPGTWLIRVLFHPGPKYYEFSVDLKVEGKPITITRAIECKPYYYSPQLQFYTPSWYPARQAMTQRLDSGAGVIVVFPRVCDENLAHNPLPADFIPVVLWADNADNPTEIEAYYSGNLVRSTASRVQFIGLRFGRFSGPSTIDVSGEFGYWENDEYPITGHKTYPKTFFATYALVISQDQWMAIPSMASVLRGTTETTVLEGTELQTASRLFQPVHDYEAQGLLDDTRVRTERLDRFAEVVPFRRVNGAFQPSLSERGIVVYYPIREVFGDRYFAGADAKSLNIAYHFSGGTVTTTLFELPSSLFDPSFRSLYQTTVGYFRFVSTQSIQGASQ